MSGGADGTTWWLVQMPRAEAKWLAGPSGPLASAAGGPRPGRIILADGGVLMDETAAVNLTVRPRLADGEVRWVGSETRVIHLHGADYELEPADGNGPPTQA